MSVSRNPSLLSTLENLIAEGKHVRLSPFVENAQFEVLMREQPDDHRRADSARLILEKDENRRLIQQIAEHWATFVKEGKDFQKNDYINDDFLKAYLAYYFSTNVPKIQLIFLELLRKKWPPTQINLLDIGVGTGTTAIALLDFLLAWGQTCELYGVPFPVKDVHIVGIDRSEGSIGYTRRVVESYRTALQKRIEGRAEGKDANLMNDALDCVNSWAEQVSFRSLDLEYSQPDVNFSPNLVVMSNVWSELSDSGKRNIENFLYKLPEKSIVVVVEPGNERRSKELMRWRRDFITNHPEFRSIAPCGQKFGNRLPSSCDNCWNIRRESLHQPLLYKKFREACHRIMPDKRGFDKYENNLLSWSYVVLGKFTDEPKESLTKKTLRDGDIISGTFRYIGSYSSKTPVSADPDEFQDNQSKNSRKKYLKVCPAGYSAYRIAIEQGPGYQVPNLRYGQLFEVTNIKVAEWKHEGIYTLIPQNNQTKIESSDLSTCHKSISDFLPNYDNKTRRAIDKIGYRLFGFSGMHDFQHRILSRTLTDKPILGIAATGGGKSECFILPAMLLTGITIVVSPLKSLMQDQYEQRIKARYGLNHLSTFINGDVSFSDREARLKRMELGYYKLVYFTPEQLERSYVLDSLRRADQKVGIRYLAIDEAHCISQWGHDFRPSYLNILRRIQARGIEPQIIALTATASPNVRQDICEELDLNPATIENGGALFVDSSNRPELNLIVKVNQTTEEKSEAILDLLKKLEVYNKNNSTPGAALIFLPHTGGNVDSTWYLTDSPDDPKVKLSTGVVPFASFLERKLGRKVAIYHGGMEDEREINAGSETKFGDLSGRARKSEQEAFIEGKRDIMVATKGFGMGIDKSNIRLAIHRTPPANLEAYAQEAGRAGRDGEFAAAVLLYSPDYPSDGKNSDYDIQSYFLSIRYVRRKDVIVMREFLRNVQHKLCIRKKDGSGTDRYLYFTNDEAIDFFNKYPGYTWPDFEQRKPKKRESLEHKQILDRGHEYEKKTKYLNRILSVLYRIRPDVHGQKRLAFIQTSQKTGARVREPKIVNWKAIQNSNAYFSKILRGISEEEFREVLHADSLLSFAERLKMPLREVTAMLEDIKYYDGKMRNKHWQSVLLNFQWIETPKFGPAKALNDNDLGAWRDYAGAKTRSNKAYKRARKNGRKKINPDDWFYWQELNRSVGWEILPGPAFEQEDLLQEYLEAFMAIHNERKENDWASYYRLLTDYVGVNEDGTTRPDGKNKCLRAVLLGYLKSYEVIDGDNCFSCSNCVLDGQFERDIEKRKKVIVRMRPDTERLLEKVESYAKKIPDETLIDELLDAIKEEEESGRSIVSYIEGWSGRLLDDTPGHRTALLIRIKAMMEGLIEVQPQAFVENANQLAQLAKNNNEVGAVWYLLSESHQILPDKQKLEIYFIQADLCKSLELYPEEEQAWKGVIYLAKRLQIKDEQLIKAYKRLSQLYAKNAPLGNPDLYVECRIHLGRLSQDAQTAFENYKQVVQDWSFEQTIEETDECRNLAGIGVLCAWAKAGSDTSIQQRTKQIFVYLESDASFLVEQATYDAVCLIISQLNPISFAKSAKFAERMVTILLDGNNRQILVKFGLMVLAVGNKLSRPILEAFSNVFWSQMSKTSIDRLLPPSINNNKSIKRIMTSLIHYFHPETINDFDHLFTSFSPEFFTDVSAKIRLQILQDVETVIEYMAQGVTIPTDVRQTLWDIVQPLMLNDKYGQKAHDVWTKIWSHIPARITEYVEMCLEANPPRPKWAEEAFGRFLETGSPSAVKLYMLSIRRTPQQKLPTRITRAKEFSWRMHDFIQEHGTKFSGDVTKDALFALRRAIAPQQSVDRADMFVAAIRVIRKQLKLNPNWLTPIALEAEALCDAQRYYEAAQICKRYPNLIGRNKESLKRRINRERKKRGLERDEKSQVRDYQLIMQICFV